MFDAKALGNAEGFYFISDYYKCAGAGSDGECSLYILTAKARKLIILLKCERLAVKVHYLISHIAVAGKLIKLCFAGKLNGGSVGKRIIDKEIYVTVLTVLSAMAVKVRALYVGIVASINCITHKTCPKKNRKIVGTGIERSVLKESVVT